MQNFFAHFDRNTIQKAFADAHKEVPGSSNVQIAAILLENWEDDAIAAHNINFRAAGGTNTKPTVIATYSRQTTCAFTASEDGLYIFHVAMIGGATVKTNGTLTDNVKSLGMVHSSGTAGYMEVRSVQMKKGQYFTVTSLNSVAMSVTATQ